MRFKPSSMPNSHGPAIPPMRPIPRAGGLRRGKVDIIRNTVTRFSSPYRSRDPLESPTPNLRLRNQLKKAAVSGGLLIWFSSGRLELEPQLPLERPALRFIRDLAERSGRVSRVDRETRTSRLWMVHDVLYVGPELQALGFRELECLA